MKWFLLFLVMLMMAGIGVGMARMNQRPFFIDENIGIGGLHTKIYGFQPYYLYSYERDGGLFVKVFYLQNKWLPKLLTLWLSGDYKGENLKPVDLVEENKVNTTLASREGVKRQLKFGQRINVWYVTGEKLGLSMAEEDRKICETSPRICQVNDWVKQKTETYSRFSRLGSIPWSVVLPVLTISNDLRL